MYLELCRIPNETPVPVLHGDPQTSFSPPLLPCAPLSWPPGLASGMLWGAGCLLSSGPPPQPWSSWFISPGAWSWHSPASLGSSWMAHCSWRPAVLVTPPCQGRPQCLVLGPRTPAGLGLSRPAPEAPHFQPPSLRLLGVALPLKARQHPIKL